MKYKIINRKKLYLTMVLDTIGKVLFSLNKLLPQRPVNRRDIKNILVIRTAYIGDAIMTLPVFKPLRDEFKGAHISFLTPIQCKDLFMHNPYIDEVITFNPFWFYKSGIGEYIDFIRSIRKRRFDLVIEARGDIRDIGLIVWPLRARYRVSYDIGGGGYFLTHIVPYPGLRHKVEYHLDIARYLGCKIEGADWDIYFTDNEIMLTDRILRDNGIAKPFIAIHPGARVPLKRWRPERYAELCDRIIDQFGIDVVLLGTDGEKPIIDDIIKHMKNRPVSLAGKLSIRELAGVIGKSTLFLCHDSAPMHMAAAMKVPSVAIFGPSKSIETSAYGTIHTVVEKDFPCRRTCDEGTCNFSRHQACMEDISVDDVYTALRGKLQYAQG